MRQDQFLSINPFQETLNASYCGPAVLKMVALACTTSELGTDEQGLIRALESIGLKAELKNESTFEDIQYWLNKQVPVIVNWFTRGRQDYSESDVADGHYSIVVGLDDEYIYIQDPEKGV